MDNHNNNIREDTPPHSLELSPSEEYEEPQEEQDISPPIKPIRCGACERIGQLKLLGIYENCYIVLCESCGLTSLLQPIVVMRDKKKEEGKPSYFG